MRWPFIRSLLLALTLLVWSSPAAIGAPPPRTPEDIVDDSDREDEDEADEPAEPEIGSYELPALIITPSDIDEPGYGVTNAYPTSMASDASYLNALMGGTEADVDDIEELLEEAGWVQSYYFSMAIASGDDPSLYATAIVNLLAEYETEEGAGVAFDLMREANAASGFRKASGGDAIGDESAVTRWSGTGSDDRPINYLDLVVRAGTIVAELYITEYSDELTDIELINAIGGTFADRIEAADDAPRVSNRSLRLTGDGVTISYAYYDRLNNAQLPAFGRSIADARADHRSFINQGVSNIYIASQQVSLSEADGDDHVEYLNYTYQFDTRDDAEFALSSWTELWIESPWANYSELEEERVSEIGDGAALISFTYERDEDVTAEGFRVYVLVDAFLVSIVAHSVDGVSQEAVEEIAEAAVDCIVDGGCEPFEVTAQMFS